MLRLTSNNRNKDQIHVTYRDAAHVEIFCFYYATPLLCWINKTTRLITNNTAEYTHKNGDMATEKKLFCHQLPVPMSFSVELKYKVI